MLKARQLRMRSSLEESEVECRSHYRNTTADDGAVNKQ